METRTMKRWPRVLPAVLFMMFAGAAAAGAQPLNASHVGYVYPAGGRQGTTVRVRVGGRYLDGVSGALVAGGGVSAQMVGLDKPLTPMQLTELRDKAQEMAKTARTPADRQAIGAIRLRIGDTVRRNANPGLGEVATLDVTIAADATPGPRQLRLITATGASNPLVFCVGQFTEFMEKEEKASKDDTELRVTLPATINGRIIPGDVDRARAPLRQPGQYMPGDVDRYRFAARKGQDLVAVVSARALMPYLADAVPGWFQATLSLLDAAGREIAYQDGFRFDPDPVIHARIPADGDYVLEIKDALYRGREDFVYRITVGEIPYITGIFPLGAPTGTKTQVALDGWNLPASRMLVDTKGTEPGVIFVTTEGGEVAANRMPFAVDTWPEVVEREPNDTARAPQPLTLPVIVNGRIEKPGDTDVFTFRGKAGQQVVAEVEARRLGSPLDSAIELTDAAGKRIAFNDDFDDPGAGLQTHYADSHLMATLPADGTYRLRLIDVQRHGGPDYAYRLRIGPPRPDFELRVTPAEINAGAGASVPITVHALRRDGFTGEIALAVKGAPAGFTLSGGVVPAGVDLIRATITVPPPATKEPLEIAIEGRASIGGRPVVRRAVAATDMMQAFAYRHLVPTDALHVSVLQRGGLRARVRVLGPEVAKVPAGGAVKVRVAMPWPRAFQNFALELSEPPDGVTLGDLVVSDEGAEFSLRADAAAAKPNLRGNLIVVVSGERVAQPQAGQTPPAGARRRFPLFTLPAIAFEIITGTR
jgi:hypothetical protein